MADIELLKSNTDDGDYERLLNRIDEAMEKLGQNETKEITLTIKLTNDEEDPFEDLEDDEEENE